MNDSIKITKKKLLKHLSFQSSIILTESVRPLMLELLLFNDCRYR